MMPRRTLFLAALLAFFATPVCAQPHLPNPILACSTSMGDTVGAAVPLGCPIGVPAGGTGGATPSAARSALGTAASGANSDITALSGLTTPLSVGQGGTGSTTAAAARTALGTAASGANSDVTSLSGLTTPLSVAQGGTGSATAAAARTALGVSATGADTTYAFRANNLSDLASASSARTNLGLGGAATLNVGTAAGTVAAGDDSRITGAAQKASNLSDLASAATARTNLGLGSLAILNTINNSNWSGTPLAVANGGTGAITAAAARAALSAAASGANSDITSLAGLTTALSVAQGGSGQATALAARGSSGLNVESAAAKGDNDFTLTATDHVNYTSAPLTAPRTWTLPAANAVNAGAQLIIDDAAGGVTATNTISAARAGSDTINGGTAAFVLDVARGRIILISDGVSKWTARLQRPYGTAAGNAVALDSSGNYPAASGAAITSLNGSNIASGIVPAARGGAGTINGALKGNGSGVVSPAACADLSNASASCSTDATNMGNAASGTLAVARGGTGATAAGATAAGNIGALAVANNLSDLNSAATSRTNLGVPPSTRAINTSGSLTGGGDLSADRTLAYAGDGAWPSFSPTVTCSNGSLASVGATITASMNYKQRGSKTYDIRGTVTVTTPGTCVLPIITIPANAVATITIAGRETSVNGKMFVGTLIPAGNTMQLTNYDNTSPVASGASLSFNGTFESQ